jgi:hypothetical protein
MLMHVVCSFAAWMVSESSVDGLAVVMWLQYANCREGLLRASCKKLLARQALQVAGRECRLLVYVAAACWSMLLPLFGRCW